MKKPADSDASTPLAPKPTKAVDPTAMTPKVNKYTNTVTETEIEIDTNTNTNTIKNIKQNTDENTISKSSTKHNDNETSHFNIDKHKAFESNFFNPNNFRIWDHLKVEMFGIGPPGNLEPPKKENILNFFSVPLKVEIVVFFGCFVCVDAFLYVFTYLPIRMVFSLYLLIMEISSYLYTKLVFNITTGNSIIIDITNMFSELLSMKKNKNNAIHFRRTQMYDLMRGSMMLIGCLALKLINMSKVYHFIRGQNMIKLYVLTSMMEVMDKLLSSFGQDAFDSLHWQTRYNPRSSRLILLFFIISLYVIIHSGLYFLSVATITVVINSADAQLLTVLILNNFSELKQFVFKKFDNNNLFQLVCSDITERFQQLLFLTIIIIVALAQAGSGWMEIIPSFGRVVIMILIGEMIADSVKHAFIAKFNSISPEIYSDFGFILRSDIVSNQKDQIILDHTYSVTRRLGLSQIPLGCVCVRYMMIAIASPSIQNYIHNHTSTFIWMNSILIFIILVLFKIVLGVGLVFYAGKIHNKELAAVSSKTIANSSKEKQSAVEEHQHTIEELANIERYTVYRGRIL